MSQEELLAWAGIGLAVVSIAIAINFYFKSRRHKEPRIYFSNRVLQTRVHPEVEITFRGERVENLSQLHVGFWNAGREAIRKEDIPTAGGPGVKFAEGCRMLSGTTLTRSNNSTRFEVERRGDDRVEFTFEYLNPGDGGLVEILYATEDFTPPIPYETVGNLIGVNSVQVLDHGMIDMSRIWRPWSFCTLLLAGYGIAWSWFAVGWIRSVTTPQPQPPVLLLLATFIGLVVFGFLAFQMLKLVWRQRSVPEFVLRHTETMSHDRRAKD